MKSFGSYVHSVFSHAYSVLVPYFVLDPIEDCMNNDQNSHDDVHQRNTRILLGNGYQIINDLLHPNDPWINKWMDLLPKDPLTQNIMFDPIVILPSGDSVDVTHAYPEFTLELYGVHDLYNYMPNEVLRRVMDMIYMRIGEIDISSSKGTASELDYITRLLQILKGNEWIYLPRCLIEIYHKNKVVNVECVKMREKLLEFQKSIIYKMGGVKALRNREITGKMSILPRI